MNFIVSLIRRLRMMLSFRKMGLLMSRKNKVTMQRQRLWLLVIRWWSRGPESGCLNHPLSQEDQLRWECIRRWFLHASVMLPKQAPSKETTLNRWRIRVYQTQNLVYQNLNSVYGSSQSSWEVMRAAFGLWFQYFNCSNKLHEHFILFYCWGFVNSCFFFIEDLVVGKIYL